MIATAALAGYLLAEAGFRAQAVAKWRAVYWMTARPRYSQLGRLQKRFSRSEHGIAAQGRRHYSIRCVRNEILSFKF